MSKWFKGLWEWLIKATKFTFSKEGLAHLDAVQKQAGIIVDRYFSIIEMIAAATPNKSDDEILAAVEKFGVTINWYPGMPAGKALAEIALLLIKRKDPTLKDNAINIAIEAMVAVLKAKGK